MPSYSYKLAQDLKYFEKRYPFKSPKDILRAGAKELRELESCANVILLEGSEQTVIEKVIPQDIPREVKDNIWDIIDKLTSSEPQSESLNTITTESESDTTSCKVCGSELLIEDFKTHVIVCSHCGIVNKELFDNGPEWRNYNNEDSYKDGVDRCGCPTNFFFPKSFQGTIIGSSCSSRLKRKQKWNSMVYKERSLNNVFIIMTDICAENNIPKIIVDTAKILYKELRDCKHRYGTNKGKQIIIRGINRTSIIAACVLKACEINKSPRTTKEIAQIFNIEEKKVNKGKNQYEKIMKNANSTNLLQNSNNETEDFIKRHCQKLKISAADTTIATTIAHNCCRMKLASDHNARSIGAGAILVMVEYRELDVDKKDIARLFGTSDVTISKIYAKLAPYVRALIDDEITDHIIKKFKING